MSAKDGLPEMPEGAYVLPFTFSGLPVWRCMALRTFKGPKAKTGRQHSWQLPCRMTFSDLRVLAEHLYEMHGLPLPEWLEVKQEA